MSILVTGGAGFIGSHTAERLLADGERIVVVDDFNDFYSPKKKQANIAGFVSHPKSVVVKADIRNSNAMNRLFSKHKINRVVHLAGLPGVRNSVENPRDYFDVNVNGTANLLELSRVHKVSQFVFASTSSVYGKAQSFPTVETDSTEKQLSPYAASKKMGEVIGRSYFLSFKLPVTCLRFFTVYGPRNRPDMAVYKFGNAIFHQLPLTMFGNGKSKRDYTFVQDVADSVSKSLYKDLGFETINIGNHEPTPLKELIKALENAFEKKAIVQKKPWPPSDTPVTYADISKARRLLHWKPKTGIKKGVQEFADWFTKQA